MCRIHALFLLLAAVLASSYAYPSPKYLDQADASPEAHLLASWIASQLRPKEFLSAQEAPILPYWLPLQEKRNNKEVISAIIGSKEAKELYGAGRK